MSRHKHVLTVAVGDPVELAAFLAARLDEAESVTRAWVALGAVEVAGRRADGHAHLPAGARVVVRVPRAPVGDPVAAVGDARRSDGARDPAAEVGDSPLSDGERAPLAGNGEARRGDASRGRVPDAMEEARGEPSWRVVHRDAALLVVDKPAGMLSQPSRGESASSLEERVRADLPSARLVHRIDRAASGLVLFALDPATHAALQQALADGDVERTYLAVAAGRLTAARDVRLRLARDPGDARRRVALPEAAPGGRPAHTHLAPIALPDGDRTALRVTLHSGRTHQIRVHLAAIGHPLVGDALYGGPPAARLALHAHRLRLRHPTSGAPLVLCAPPPPELGLTL